MNKKEDILNKIPEHWNSIREFVEKRNENDYFEVRDNELIIDEIFFGNRQYMIVIDVKRNSIEFRDDLVVTESTERYLDNIDYEEWNSALENLKNEISKFNFKLFNTGNGGNDDYIWYGISTNVSNFKEENLIKVTELWDNYNTERRNIIGLNK